MAGTQKPRNARLSRWWAHTDSNRGPRDYEFAHDTKRLVKSSVAYDKYVEARAKQSSCGSVLYRSFEKLRTVPLVYLCWTPNLHG
jgi:hypothetical protein